MRGDLIDLIEIASSFLLAMTKKNVTILNATWYKGYAVTRPHGQAGDDLIGYIIPFEEWPAALKKVYDHNPKGAETALRLSTG